MPIVIGRLGWERAVLALALALVVLVLVLVMVMVMVVVVVVVGRVCSRGQRARTVRY